ncbi:carbonic anhydrase 6-like [Sitophilus oryzae]|uniref:carbonic anhydrase n=1 Tax=Sitophilus oryzae TaxID=7048 RepID=A0A6J2YRE8_SITOR|nr:carbonic anhydrase 6-like [Sitophilus oryzae]
MKTLSQQNIAREEHWPKVHCKKGRQQSPIALSQKTSYLKNLEPIKLENFDQDYILDVHHLTDLVVLKIPDMCPCSKPKISGGGLTQTYILENLHFHWPSEHTIDGIRYDMECHFVLYSTKYRTFKEALAHPFAVAVMAVLNFKTNYTQSNNFKIIAEATKKLKGTGTKQRTTEPLKFIDFLPYDLEKFFYYEGSFSVPWCPEYVHWLVFKNTANIQSSYYMDMKQIRGEDGELVESNNRTLQNINGRKVILRTRWFYINI